MEERQNFDLLENRPIAIDQNKTRGTPKQNFNLNAGSLPFKSCIDFLLQRNELPRKCTTSSFFLIHFLPN